MTLATFAPTYAPGTSGVSKTVTARVRRAQFGDGYSLRVVDGLNAVTRTVTLTWPVLVSSDAQNLEDFFSGKAGATAFLYTLPGESVQRTWTAPKWSRQFVTVVTESFSVDLIEEFDL